MSNLSINLCNPVRSGNHPARFCVNPIPAEINVRILLNALQLLPIYCEIPAKIFFKIISDINKGSMKIFFTI